MRRGHDLRIGHVFRSTPNSFLHEFVASKNAFLIRWNDPLHRNSLVNLWQNRPRLDTAGLVSEYHSFLFLVSADAATPLCQWRFPRT